MSYMYKKICCLTNLHKDDRKPAPKTATLISLQCKCESTERGIRVWTSKLRLHALTSSTTHDFSHILWTRHASPNNQQEHLLAHLLPLNPTYEVQPQPRLTGYRPTTRTPSVRSETLSTSRTLLLGLMRTPVLSTYALSTREVSEGGMGEFAISVNIRQRCVFA